MEVFNASRAEEAELCLRFGRRVRLYGRRRLRDDSAVDDLVQRVLLLLVTKLRGGEVREPERVDSFVLGTARMLTRELSRGRERAELDEQMPCPLSETRPDPLALDRLGECLKALAERDRTADSTIARARRRGPSGSRARRLAPRLPPSGMTRRSNY